MNWTSIKKIISDELVFMLRDLLYFVYFICMEISS